MIGANENLGLPWPLRRAPPGLYVALTYIPTSETVVVGNEFGLRPFNSSFVEAQHPPNSDGD